MEYISSQNAPKAIGPYSQAVKVGQLLFTSGQIPIDPANGEIVGTEILVQTQRVCENLSAVLAAAGVGFSDVVKTTCFLSDMTDFAAFNSVYERYFVSKPARSCVAVRTLPKNVLVEIELIAEIK